MIGNPHFSVRLISHLVECEVWERQNQMERNDKRLAYQGKIEAYLKEWGSQIDRWQERVNANTQQLIGELNHKRQAVRTKFAEMKGAGDDQWQNFRSSLDQAVEDMRQAINNAREQFRRP